MPNQSELQPYLDNLVPICSHKLRKLLISTGCKEQKCECCGNTHWSNFPIPLQLHHIDGNNKNNNLTNLQVLCYNCHALTGNFRDRSRNSPVSPSLADYQNAIESSINTRQACLALGIAAYGGNYSIVRSRMDKYGWKFREKTDEEKNQLKKRMKEISQKRKNWLNKKPIKVRDKKTIAENRSYKVKNRPARDDLLSLVWSKSVSQIAASFSVTDNAIRKWAFNYKIPVPPVGYWRKMETGRVEECATIKAQLYAQYGIT